MIDLPWCCGPCECLQCGEEWAGVWPLGCPELECPACGSTDTVRDSMTINDER